MMQRAFQHRSGRVISLSRIVLALVFFVAVWIDPTQPARHEAIGYPLLAAYLLFAAAVLAVSWSNWWLDFRLAIVAHIVDIFVLLAGAYFTESYTSTFTSPFFAFFAYVLFAATMRWGWRATAATAAVTVLLYFALGLAVQWGEADFDVYRFSRRVTYLLVLSMVLIWFGINQQVAAAKRLPGELEVRPDAKDPPISAALSYAMQHSGAARAVFAWWAREEPWIHVCQCEDGVSSDDRFGPAELGPIVSDIPARTTFLFDRPRARALYWAGPERLLAADQPVDAGFATRFRLERGLCIPVHAGGYEGFLFLGGVNGLCCDDLRVGSAIGREIAAALDRFSMMVLSEESAVNRARDSIARDLHDSVAQALAGAAFRIEALRSWIRAGKDPEPEIVAVKEALRIEQRHVRSLIAKLRLGGGSLRRTDIAESLRELSPDIRRQWDVGFQLNTDEGPLEGPAWMAHELHQLVREAVANAVRHGSARSITLDLTWDAARICVVITDDGDGFPGGDGSMRPWSIHDRVNNLGGTLTLQSSAHGAKLDIAIPREAGE